MYVYILYIYIIFNIHIIYIHIHIINTHIYIYIYYKDISASCCFVILVFLFLDFDVCSVVEAAESRGSGSRAMWTPWNRTNPEDGFHASRWARPLGMWSHSFPSGDVSSVSSLLKILASRKISIEIVNFPIPMNNMVDLSIVFC